MDSNVSLPKQTGQETIGGNQGLSKKEQQDYESKFREARLDSYLTTIDQRKKFARNIFVIIVTWLFLVTFIIFANGCRWWGFTLYETSFTVLIGTTTANIIGLAVIVLKYVFKDHPMDRPSGGN